MSNTRLFHVPEQNLYHVLWFKPNLSSPPSYNTLNMSSSFEERLNTLTPHPILRFHVTTPRKPLIEFLDHMKELHENEIYSCIVMEVDFSRIHQIEDISPYANNINSTPQLNNILVCFIDTKKNDAKYDACTPAALLTLLNSMMTNNTYLFLGDMQQNTGTTPAKYFGKTLADLVVNQKNNPEYYKNHTPAGCLKNFSAAHKKLRGWGLFHWRTNVFSDSTLENILYNATREKQSLSQQICLNLGWIKKNNGGIELNPEAPYPVRLAYENKRPHPKQAERNTHHKPSQASA